MGKTVLILLVKFYSWIDDVIYAVSNFFDPIPPHRRKEMLDEYVRRIEKRHALRYLKHRIDKQLDLTPENEEKEVNRYHRKRDKKLVGSLITMMRQAQNEEIALYRELNNQP